MPRDQISTFIVCCNEEKNIRRCLEGIKWSDEIVIIDSGSTDHTLEICREYTSKILHREWSGYVEQKRYGLLECTSEWVLNVDADEVVSPELQAEILDVLSDKNDTARESINGYLLSRVVYHLGKWWRKGGWYPEYRLRLCRKSATTWGGTDPHEKAMVSGSTRKLKGELLHYTYTGVSDQINRLNRYSSTTAQSMYDEGERANPFNIVFNPLLRFLKFYFLKKGFLEGFPGLIVAYIEGYYVFLKYVKLWEIQRKINQS